MEKELREMLKPLLKEVSVNSSKEALRIAEGLIIEGIDKKIKDLGEGGEIPWIISKAVVMDIKALVIGAFSQVCSGLDKYKVIDEFNININVDVDES